MGCVADGTAAVGEACTRGPAGETTGFDDCVAGAICINNACADLCGFDGSPEAACGAGEHCTAYADLFANDSEEPTAGACTPTCNPVTQQFADGGTCPANQGCYLLVSSTTTIAVCAGAGTIQHNQEIIGTAYANSCEPGHTPRRRDQTTMVVECGALCAPANVTSTTNQNDEGGVAPNDCVARGAAAPGDGTTGESCRYWWMRESGEMVTPFSNTVGWCFKHAVFQYDSDGDMTPDAPFPRCVSLTTGDILPPIENPPGNDALYFGCVERPTMRRLSGPNRTPARLVRPPSVSLPEHGLRLDRLDGW